MADFDFITPRLAVGGCIWNPEQLPAVQRAGLTHIINTQAEFDHRFVPLADDYRPIVLHLGTEDDLEPKPASYFRRGVRFALEAFARPGSKLLVHCASGIHRGPMVALAILRVLGHGRRDAQHLIREARPAADFPDVYLDSVEAFLAEWETSPPPR